MSLVEIGRERRAKRARRVGLVVTMLHFSSGGKGVCLVYLLHISFVSSSPHPSRIAGKTSNVRFQTHLLPDPYALFSVESVDDVEEDKAPHGYVQREDGVFGSVVEEDVPGLREHTDTGEGYQVRGYILGEELGWGREKRGGGEREG